MPKAGNQKAVLFVVAVDGSGASATAADRAVELANKLGAQLAIIMVEDPRGITLPPTTGGGRRRKGPKAREVVDGEWRRAKQEGVSAEKQVIEGLDPAHEIVAFAEARGAEMIVIGSRGLTGIKRVLLGSVAAKVVALAHCPVLVVR